MPADAGIVEGHRAQVAQGGRRGETLLVKVVPREREAVQEAVRRFRKLVERTGLKRELRRRERYEKPSDIKRKARIRSIRRSKTRAQAG